MLWPAVEAEFASAFNSADIAMADDDDGVWRVPHLRRFSNPWEAPRILPLPGPLPPEADTEAAEEEVEFYWVGTEARIAGTVVHRWLQVLAEGRTDLDAADSHAQQQVTRRWLREMGIGDELQVGIAARVQAALDGVRNDAKGRWILAGDGRAEFALTGQYGGAIESVVLDRVRIDEDGDHWIIDYKTSTHEGGNLQGFLKAEVDRYAPQLEKYAALYAAYSGRQPRCALYFPLLQEFVEV
jgi:ATP-dependent exoDNAse (exonuclease V) beta subunit